MDQHARIELFGGPEDGREMIIPNGMDGAPVTPLPVPSGETETASSPDVALYERAHQRPDGQWVYRYAVSQTLGRPAA